MKFLIHGDSVGMRLDKFLSGKVDTLSRAKIQNLIKSGVVVVNGLKSKVSQILAENDEVLIGDFGEKIVDIPVKKVNLEILYEDKDFLIVDKPAGMVVHPGDNVNNEPTLVDAVFDKIEQGVGDEMRPGIVHRLDKDTSGLLIVAKNKFTYEYFVNLFKTRKIEKRYLALVLGVPEHAEGVIDSPIGRSIGNRKKMDVLSQRDGKKAISVYKVLKEFSLDAKSSMSLLDVEIKTGRTHQIRVHLAAIGHPVVGDTSYGVGSFNRKIRDEFGLNRQFLHASKLIFEHPRSGKLLTIESKLSSDLQQVLSSLPQ